MRYYCSKCNSSLNGLPYRPERATPYLCINPYYRVKLDPIPGTNLRCMMDSGAFQDVSADTRLSPAEALQRQLAYEEALGIVCESIVSYDRLVDEQLGDSGQFKARVAEDIGNQYVDETVEAARYLASQRERLAPRKLILSCQGTTVDQYIGCVERVLEFAEPGDILGIGGFCILSKSLDYEEQFYDVIARAFPLIRDAGLDRAHIFGVGVFRALVQADICARLHGIECSYDTSSAEINAVFGRLFNPMSMQMAQVFAKAHKNDGYRPADLAMANIGLIGDFWRTVGAMPLPDSFRPGLVNKRSRAKQEVEA